jgi:putative phage-type endonuclease
MSADTTTVAKEELINADCLADRLFKRFFDAHNGLCAVDQRQECIDAVFETLQIVFTTCIVKKEYVEQRFRKLIDYRKQLQYLLSLPKLQQRTPEWYEARNAMITASDFAQAIGKGKFGTQRDFYIKKSGYEDDNFDQSNPALQWGVMFEQVACDAYSVKNNGIHVHEFGLLKHPTVPHLGASPDGISELGIMLEIKCPYRRKITGEIPYQYYCQMQGQLDVCDLAECDYLECKITTYASQSEFESKFDADEDYKGIVVDTVDGNRHYVDKALWKDLSSQIEWLSSFPEEQVQKITFWRLDTYSCQRVYKRTEFISDLYPQLAKSWQQIVSFKQDRPSYDQFIGSVKKKPVREVFDISGSGSKLSTNNRFIGYAFVDDS